MNYYIGKMIVLENPTRHVEVKAIDLERKVLIVQSWVCPETGLKEIPLEMNDEKD